jgi:hypothetical protein
MAVDAFAYGAAGEGMSGSPKSQFRAMIKLQRELWAVASLCKDERFGVCAAVV